MASEQVVSYVMRYGGRCRDCADEDGICPTNGTPCEPEVKRAVIKHTLTALEYGISHGFIADPFTRPAPAATDTGLETVAPTYITYNPVYHVTYEGADPKRGYVYVQTNTCPASVEALQTIAWDTWGRGLRYSLRSQPEPGDEALVYRWRAEELLAAAHDEKMFHVNDAVKAWNEVSKLETRVDALEVDNAAQAARIKELEADVKREAQSSTHNAQDCLDEQLRAEALEAKLAAAEKVREAAIELDEAISDDFNIFGAQQKLRAALGGKP